MTTYLVKLLIELIKLGCLGHDVLVDHEWRLNFLVSLFPEEIETVVNQRLVEINTIVGKIVSSVPNVLCTFEYLSTSNFGAGYWNVPRSRSIASNRRRASW